MSKELKIACPKCEWQPDGGAYWGCDHCGHNWNTFETGGRCPACKTQYKMTQCIGHRGGCDQVSPHLEWYTELSNWLEEQLASIEEPVLS